MFTGLVTLRGGEGVIVWGYHTAAVCRHWTITKSPEGAWQLQAQVQRADPFQLRQRRPPLLFRAPRKGGHFCWPVLGVSCTGSTLAAALGPPEA